MNELTAFHGDVKNILEQARSAVNAAMVEVYWLIGMKTKLFLPSFPRSCVGTHTEVKQERGMGSQACRVLLTPLTCIHAGDAGAWEPEKQEILYTACRELSWSHLRSRSHAPAWERIRSITNG